MVHVHPCHPSSSILVSVAIAKGYHDNQLPGYMAFVHIASLHLRIILRTSYDVFADKKAYLYRIQEMFAFFPFENASGRWRSEVSLAPPPVACSILSMRTKASDLISSIQAATPLSFISAGPGMESKT